MTKTLLQLKTRMLVLLDDPESGTFTDAIITEGAHSALRQILEYYPKLAQADITTFTGSGPYVGAMPTDLHSVDAVLDLNSKQMLPKASLAAGSYQGTNIETNDWHVYTAGTITFSKELTSGCRVYYRAQWDEPAADGTDLETPDFLLNMLAYYGCYEACVAKATKAGNIRQFNLKVDSGNPVQNPLLDLAQRFLIFYHNSAKMLPDLEKPSVVGS